MQRKCNGRQMQERNPMHTGKRTEGGRERKKRARRADETSGAERGLDGAVCHQQPGRDDPAEKPGWRWDAHVFVRGYCWRRSRISSFLFRLLRTGLGVSTEDIDRHRQDGVTGPGTCARVIPRFPSRPELISSSSAGLFRQWICLHTFTDYMSDSYEPSYTLIRPY